MLLLLRQVRRKLMTENKVTTYVLYGLAEVFLIVVGILIAVSIENMNEERKEQIIEVDILHELLRTLRDGTATIDRSINENQSTITSINTILDHIDKDKPYADSLAWHFENAFIWWKGLLDLSAYERAKEYGLYFIQNDTLRTRLSQLYSVNHEFAETLNRREELYYYHATTPVLTKLFRSTEVALLAETIRGENVPYDYEALKVNKEYRTILLTTLGNREKLIIWLKMRKELMLLIDKLLVEEIERNL